MLKNSKFYRKSKGGVWYKDGSNSWTHAKTEQQAKLELEQIRALSPFGYTFHIEEIERYI